MIAGGHGGESMKGMSAPEKELVEGADESVDPGALQEDDIEKDEAGMLADDMMGGDEMAPDQIKNI